MSQGPLSLRTGKSYYSFQITGIIYSGFTAIGCLFPFLLVISGSFTSEEEIFRSGYNLIPKVFSMEAYALMFKNPKMILNAYAVTTFVTAVTTIASVYLTALTGYILSRPDFRARNHVSFFIYFSMLFGPGLLVSYILIVKYLAWKNNLLALIVPGLMNPYYIILIKNFIRTSIPNEIIESAKMDGAGVFRTYMMIVLPLLKPAVATIALFTALGMWNSWFGTMLYIDKKELFMLQYYLYKAVTNMQFLKNNIQAMQMVGQYIVLPEQSFKLATAIVATGPIVLLYPFMQKYFIKGLTIGAVKG